MTNRCIAIDLSGHGKSELIEEEPSIDRCFSHEVGTLVKHLGLEDFILVGHSMGGGVAMSYTLNEDFISPKALVLIDTSPVLNLSKIVPGIVKEVVEERISHMKELVGEHVSYEETLRAVDPIAMQRDLRACRKFDISDRVKDITIPTFVIVGEDDDIITPATVMAFEKELPRSDIAVVRGADHIPMIEQPEEFNRLLRKFINWVQENA